jgi:hypothetical protein
MVDMRHCRLVAVVIGLIGAGALTTGVACSSFEADDAGAEPDVSVQGPERLQPDGGLADGATAADSRTCDPSAVFGPPVPVADVNTSTASNIGARLTADELTMYFASLRVANNGYDLYLATRPSVGLAFTVRGPIEELSTTESERSPSLAADGLELAFTFGTDVKIARRTSTSGPFAAAELLAAANEDLRADIDPFMAPNGDVYFASNRATGAPSRTAIYFVKRLVDGGFEQATAVPVQPSLAGPASDGYPVLSSDGLALYFGSTRTDDSGDVEGDIWMVRRDAPNAAFGPPTRIGALSSPGFADFPTWLSADNCRLYLSSTRGGNGIFQIYVATRPR